ncbi:hypothetical protein Cmtc_57630 [Cupriavidus sp. TKC]|nr:hypothetical protein Cmtc_57630 [Cupriavidus sp. TKC]
MAQCTRNGKSPLRYIGILRKDRMAMGGPNETTSGRGDAKGKGYLPPELIVNTSATPPASMPTA